MSARAMFGGFGLYLRGVMFALIADETLYFKTDAVNRAAFEEAGMAPFVYENKGRKVQCSRGGGQPERSAELIQRPLHRHDSGARNRRRIAGRLKLFMQPQVDAERTVGQRSRGTDPVAH